MSASASSARDVAVGERRAIGPDQATGAAERAVGGAFPTLRYLFLKRSIDVLGASVLIIATSPLFVLIAVMIVLDSGWPVFYRQERVTGRARRQGGRVDWAQRRFRIVKFRTMVPRADAVPLHEQFIESFVHGRSGPGATGSGEFKLEDDPRITRVGRWLRATSLDELPQLFNVLGGTMSLVGPRPVPSYEVALYEARHQERLAARGGITGAWQIKGRGRVSFEEMIRLDIDYVRRQSLGTDLVLLARTLPAVWRKIGAR
jgi:lipopolysaccharide/colanic/teichoic acid biosynthesis glycosyltransferase